MMIGCVGGSSPESKNAPEGVRLFVLRERLASCHLQASRPCTPRLDLSGSDKIATMVMQMLSSWKQWDGSQLPKLNAKGSNPFTRSHMPLYRKRSPQLSR